MDKGNGRHVDQLVIGAGISGLCAASALKTAGVHAVVVDKGRGVGGRMATRRIGGATLDHGAQFVTARTGRFERWLGEACVAGAAAHWSRGFPPAGEGHVRWRGTNGMSGIAKHFAAGLEVELGRQVSSVSRSGNGWMISMAGGGEWTAGSLVLTAPVPQSLRLLDAGGVVLETGMRARLEAVRYECCLAVLAVLERPSTLPFPGGFAPETGPVSWIADNQQKGISAEPAVTLHAGEAYSRENWERDRDTVARELLASAGPWIGAEILKYEVHGWRYSRPLETDLPACWVLTEGAPLVLAGDAFGGPRVEGAALSGWAAGEALAEHFSRR